MEVEEQGLEVWRRENLPSNGCLAIEVEGEVEGPDERWVLVGGR